MDHRIQIVVPTLNSYTLLPRLVKSLQQQTFLQWRLLFIDGNSGPQHRNWLEQCCAEEPRCRWLLQNPSEPGIFGAMNCGFCLVGPADWLLFWGSDDWAATPTVLAEVSVALATAATHCISIDLLICRGRYVSTASRSLARDSVFQPAGVLDASAYRRALFYGSTPPHQATLLGPSARQRIANYTLTFFLSADLDYFLQLSRYPEIRVKCIDLELVLMADGGVSGQQPQRRLQEVFLAYSRAFGWNWWIPFLMRYLRRMVSLLDRSR